MITSGQDWLTINPHTDEQQTSKSKYCELAVNIYDYFCTRPMLELKLLQKTKNYRQNITFRKYLLLLPRQW